MHELYVLLERPERNNPHWSCYTEFLTVGRTRHGPAAHCSVCGDCIGPLTWLPPFRVTLECFGPAFGDIVFGVGGGDSFLVSERFRAIYEEQDLSGLSGFEPVEVRRVKGRKRAKGEVPPCYRVTAERSQAAIDQAASGFEWETPPTCPTCRQGDGIERWARLVLEPNTWAGEDIFIPRGLFAYVTSGKFKRVCDEHKIRNATFVPAEEYWHDFYPGRNVKRMSEIMAHPLDGTVLERVKAAGEVWRYCVQTGELVVRKSDGTLDASYPHGGVEFFRTA